MNKKIIALVSGISMMVTGLVHEVKVIEKQIQQQVMIEKKNHMEEMQQLRENRKLEVKILQELQSQQ